MDHLSSGLSTSSPSDYAPFHNNNQNNKLPWFCYLCGTEAAENSERLDTQKKQKKNISKILKNSRHSTFRKSVTLESQIPEIVEKNDLQRKFFPNGSGLKSTISTVEGIEDKKHFKHLNQNFAQNKQANENKKLMNGHDHAQRNMKTQLRDSLTNQGKIQSLAIGNSQKMVYQTKNMPQLVYYLPISGANPQITDTSKFRKSEAFFYGNPIRSSGVQNNNQSWVSREKILKGQQNGFEREVTLTSCKSYDIIEYSENKNKNSQNSVSKLSTKEEIPPPFTYFREVVSVNDRPELSQNMKKENSDNQIKETHAIRTLKKKSSRSESGEMQKSIESEGSQSSYIQFGNKIRIGIRKAQSINSKGSDEDQYSEVLSHGQKSFLMPEIHEVEEMSRVSSASGFRNWEDGSA